MKIIYIAFSIIGSRLDIAENQDEIAAAFEGVSEDLGYKVKVIYTDPSKSPQLIGVDENGNEYIKDGTAYVDKTTGIGYILVNTESPANSTKAGVIGTIAEEQSHVIGKFEGRQKVVPDGSEKGLESLGRPANDYVKNKLGEDNNSKIKLSTDGIDLTNANVGEKVGDVNTQDDRNSGYAETLPSQKDQLWLNNMHFRLLKFKKGINEFKYVALGTAIRINSMLFNPEDKTIRDFTLGAFSAGAEDLSLNTYKIPEKFKYNTLSYKYGELFGHSTMSALGILGNITGSGMQGGGTAAAPATGGVSLGVAAIGAGVQTYSVGVIGTSAINSAKVGLDIKAMKSEGGSSDNNSNKSIEDTKNLEKELEELKDGWGKGSFSDKEVTIKYHYNKHKEEVGADSLLQYLRKAKAFSKNLRGAKKRKVTGATKGVIKYEKNGKYIEIAPNGDIISFGTIK